MLPRVVFFVLFFLFSRVTHSMEEGVSWGDVKIMTADDSKAYWAGSNARRANNSAKYTQCIAGLKRIVRLEEIQKNIGESEEITFTINPSLKQVTIKKRLAYLSPTLADIIDEYEKAAYGATERTGSLEILLPWIIVSPEIFEETFKILEKIYENAENNLVQTHHYVEKSLKQEEIYWQVLPILQNFSIFLSHNESLLSTPTVKLFFLLSCFLDLRLLAQLACQHYENVLHSLST